MKNSIIKIVSVLTLGLLLFSCEDELNVENTNDVKLDVNKTETSDELINMSKGLFKSWWISTYHINKIDNPSIVLLLMADAGSCSWGNWGMYDLSAEPRLPFNNIVSYSNAAITNGYFKAIMANISSCNKIISAGKNNKLGDKKALAVAYFMRGLSYGYLSAVFDKAFLITEDTDISKHPFEVGKTTIKDHKEILKQALSDLDKTISIASSNTFSCGNEYFTKEVSNLELSKIANSYAARLMIYGSRNKTEDNNLDWAKVLNYAKKGITSDFAIKTKKASGNWTTNDYINTYNTYAGYWAKVDMRLIHLMDPNMPNTFPVSGKVDELPNKGKATSSDKRLETDFEYDPNNNFKPERGYYHYGTYTSKKHNFMKYMTKDTESISMYKYENDLMIAEAEAHLGNVAGAITILNSGNRKLKGGLETNSSETKEKVLEIISYERQIDLFLSTFGLEFFEMRRHNLLQKGTFLHFPIPAEQLNNVNMPMYTFGGTIGVAGKDYSDKGWK